MESPISQKLQQAIEQLKNPDLAQSVWQYLKLQEFQGFLPHFVVEELCQQYQLDKTQLALQLLPLAACYARTPISHFNVGAIVIGAQGDFYFGANQEFTQSHIQQTIHAEQSAISHAWMRGERAISDVVVNYTPCGHCRQFMNELNSAEQLKIHLPHSQNNPLHQYLPDAFGPKDLNISNLLLDKEDHQFDYPSENPLIRTALQAANRAHAPYSNSYHGVALQTYNQKIFHGSYAENAAFNPSLPALQVALNYLMLCGEQIENIEKVVMVEKTGDLSYRKMAEELMDCLLDRVEFEYISI